MKFNMIFLFLLSVMTVTISSCGSQTDKNDNALTIHGTITGGENMKIYFDKLDPIDNLSEILAQEMIGENGTFSIGTKQDINPGIFRLRIGNMQSIIALDGTEKDITINGELSTFNRTEYAIEGAPAVAEYQSILSEMKSSRMQAPQVIERVSSMNSVFNSVLLSQQIFQGKPDFLGLYETIAKKLNSEQPDHQITKSYNTLVSQIKLAKQQKAANQKIQVGQPAPDISLPSPDGKTMSLSETKGSIVLLDFWASWCGPCRRANPKVVALYDKYKSQGFTVFSVSLDGVDSRTAQRLGSDPQKVASYTKQTKDKWIQAIEKDNLKWKWHVSDLKKWEAAPAATYGVRSIPQTFLIDKDGKIAAINPRNNLEEEIKKLL